jgi:hypothetical protein
VPGGSERLLYAFSRAYLTAPASLLPLDAEDARVYTALYQQVEQFRKKRGSMAIRDIDAAQKSYQEVFAEILDQLPPDLLVRKLTPEQRMAGLLPEQRMAGLAPEQIASALPPEALEQILGALPPEVLERIVKKLRH